MMWKKLSCLLAALCTVLLYSCSSNPKIDSLYAQRDIVAFDADKLGIKPGSTVHISIYNSNEFVQQIAKKIEQAFAARNIRIIKQGATDYWLQLNGAFDHYSDTPKSAQFNRNVYVKDTGTSRQVKLRIRTVNPYSLTSIETPCTRTNREYRPRIFYKDTQYSSAGMVCGITLYRTNDLSMLTCLQASEKTIERKTSVPLEFQTPYAKAAGEFIVKSIIVE